MRLAPTRLAFTLALFTLGLTACDAITGDGSGLPSEVSGTVVSLSTGEPIPGLSVAFQSVGIGGGTVAGTVTTTDAAGRFSIRTDNVGDADHLFVNTFPNYNPDVFNWQSFNRAQPLGRDMRIELWEVAGLVVYAETDTPLGPGDRAFIDTPCIGADRSPVRSVCARANASNTVTLTVLRGGATTVRSEEVYTPLGETTVVRWAY